MMTYPANNRKERKMKHRLVIKTSKTPEPDSIFSMKKMKPRQIRKLLSSTTRPVLVLGASVAGITIEEIKDN